MARILQKLGLEPVVAREVETGLLTMVLAAFSLLAIHTVGLSWVIHFNRVATTLDGAALEESREGKGAQTLAQFPKNLNCETKKESKGGGCE